MTPFSYACPKNLEALEPYLAENATLLAGGQSLLPDLKAGLHRPESLVDIKRFLPREVRLTQGRLVIGAGATHAEIANHPVVRSSVPTLALLAESVGDPSVRNRGTLGGSLAYNHPASDWAAAALALDATLHTHKGNMAFRDYARTPHVLTDSVILSVSFSLPTSAAYVKLLHPAQRYALVGSFVAQGPNGTRLALSGLSSQGAFRWREAEQLRDIEASLLETLALPELPWRHDSFASAPYRQHLARKLSQRAVLQIKGVLPPQVSLTHGQPLLPRKPVGGCK